MYPEKLSSLEIKGYVFEKDEKVNGAMVRLYQNNKIVQMTKTKKSKFEFVLFSGMRYMVEVVKPGSVTERIQISTLERLMNNEIRFENHKYALTSLIL